MAAKATPGSRVLLRDLLYATPRRPGPWPVWVQFESLKN